MRITYEQLVVIVVDSIASALGVSEEELMSISEGLSLDLGFDQGVDVEVDFNEPIFMHRYYGGSRFSMMFNVTGDEAFVHAFIGANCSDPDIANEFVDRYMAHARFANVWRSPDMCERERGLMLASDFSFRSERELEAELTRRLALFVDEHFTNELRPFIHYFED